MVDYKPLKRLSGTRKQYDRRVRAICQECPAGCGIYAYVRDERIVDVHGDEEHPVSRGRLCAKGIAFVQGLTHPERITLPGTRNRLQGPFEAFDNWEKGLDLLAERLRRVRDQHGPESLVIGCDPIAGQDFLLGARRFARLWGTPHVYSPLDELPDETGPVAAPAAPCTEWPHARCLFLVEADLASTHPVTFGWVMRAQKAGAKIVAVDTRFTATLSKADIALTIAPESGNLLGLSIMKRMLDAGLSDPDAADAAIAEAEAWRAYFDSFHVEDVDKATGLSAEQIEQLARALASCSPVTVVTGKRLSHRDHCDIWPTMVAAVGWTRKKGGGWYPMECGNPSFDPETDIAADVAPEAGSKKRIFTYQSNTSHRKGGLAEQVAGTKALIGSGNCLNDFLSPFAKTAGDMDLSVYFGAFPNVTRKMSHMVFPEALWPERFGVCFGNDRLVQWGERIVAPGDACRTGLGLWIRLAERLGWGEYFPWKKANNTADLEAFYDWLLKRRLETAGLTVSLLKENPGGVSWPLDLARQERKTVPARAPESPLSSDSGAGGDYPFYYQATRISSQFSDPSRWWPWTREHHDDKAVQIHPDTAGVLGIQNGDEIVVRFDGEAFPGRAALSRMVGRNMVWSTRRIGEKRVMVAKKGQDDQEALTILKGYLQ